MKSKKQLLFLNRTHTLILYAVFFSFFAYSIGCYKLNLTRSEICKVPQATLKQV